METTPTIEPPESVVAQRCLEFWHHIRSPKPSLRLPVSLPDSFWRSYGTHIAVGLVVILTIVCPQLSNPVTGLSLPRSLPGFSSREYLEDVRLLDRGGRPAPAVMPDLVLQRAGVVHTIKGSYPEWESRVYRVENGDTLSGIAARFGLSMKTVLWANEALVKAPDSLSIGQELVILPVDGAYHTVAQGETLQAIADRYKVDPEVILSYGGNEIEDPAHLVAGTKLIVPGAELPEPPPRVVAVPAQERTYTARVANPQEGSGSFIWPVSGYISQGVHSGHVAVDIAGNRGSPVVAADSGTVTLVSWMRTSYGYHVIVDHGNGLETLYAHLDSISVEVGQNVAKGEAIGTRGSTGRSTGPHLHFEVRENGVKRNPFSYLP
ncbi:MAG: M23 family metallopeptidase [Anaerolineae bacterium]|nr:M23 family metallopeptidase [Anaerolineae bacterium]